MSQKLKPKEMMSEPIRPEDWECCNSDCGEACIWQIYYREKAIWDEQQHLLSRQLVIKKPLI